MPCRGFGQLFALQVVRLAGEGLGMRLIQSCECQLQWKR